MRRTVLLVCLAACVSGTPTHAQNEDLETFYTAHGLLNRGLYDLAAPEYRRFLEENPDSEHEASARYGLGVALFRLGEHSEAGEQLDRIIDDNGFAFASEVLVLRAHCHMRLGEHRAAAERFGELLNRYPAHASAGAAAALRVESLYRAGDMNGAVEAAGQTESLAQNPEDRDRFDMFWGLALSALGDDAAASARFEPVAGQGRSAYSDRAVLLLAQSRHRAGDTALAADGYRAVIERGVAALQPEAMLGLAQTLRAQGETAEPRDVLEHMLNDHADSALAPVANLELGLALYDDAEYEAARESLRRVIRSERPDLHDDAAYWVGKCLLREDEPAKAARAFQGAIELAPDGELVAEAMYDRAVALSRADDPEADDTFAAFLDRFPDHTLGAEALAARVSLAHGADDHARSLELSDAFAERYPDHALAGRSAFLGAEAVYLMSDYDEAADRYEQFLNEHAGHEHEDKASYRLAMTRYRLGDFDEGEPLLRRAAERADDDPFFRPSLLALGEGLFARGDYPGSREMLERYAAFGSDAPNADDALVRLGLARARLDDHAGAVEAFDRLLEDHPSSSHRAHARFERGQALVELERFDEAQRELETLLDESPGSRFEAYAMRHLGALARREGRDDDAADWFSRARRAGGADVAPGATLDEGRALLASGRYQEAVEALGAVSGDPELEREARASRAIALSRVGEHEQAVEAIGSLSLDDYDRDTAQALRYERAWALRSLGRDEESLAAYRELIQEGHETGVLAHAMLEAAGLEMDAERFDLAARLLDELSSIAGRVGADDDLIEQATYRRGVAAFRLGDHETVASTLNDFRDRWSASELADSADLVCADSMSELGRHEEAAERFERVAGSGDENLAAPALLGLGRALVTLQHWDRAESAFAVYLERFPERELWFQAAFGRGWSLENRSRHDEAIDAYRTVTSRHKGPTAARAQFQIGECLFAQERHEEAARELLKVDILYAYPEWSAAALYEAGRCFESLNQRHQAREQYERVVQNHAETEWAVRAQRRLDTISDRSLPGRGGD